MTEWKNECHTGEWCLYKALVCQEGFCCGCQIYLDAVSQAVSDDIQLEKIKVP